MTQLHLSHPFSLGSFTVFVSREVELSQIKGQVGCLCFLQEKVEDECQ